MDEKDDKIYYGQANCQHGGKKICPNKAYYQSERLFLCGIHSRALKRILLPKISQKLKSKNKDRKLKKDTEEIEKAAKYNKQKGLKGQVILTKLRMMKSVEDKEGFLKIFPNYKHRNRKDGFGCCSLSPMSLGPVDHGQPNLPQSQNLENFHQGLNVTKEKQIKIGTLQNCI